MKLIKGRLLFYIHFISIFDNKISWFSFSRWI